MRRLQGAWPWALLLGAAVAVGVATATGTPEDHPVPSTSNLGPKGARVVRTFLEEGGARVEALTEPAPPRTLDELRAAARSPTQLSLLDAAGKAGHSLPLLRAFADALRSVPDEQVSTTAQGGTDPLSSWQRDHPALVPQDDASRGPLVAIPAQVEVVVIAAPAQREVSEEEVSALERFVRGGGRLVYLSPRPARLQPHLARWLKLSDASSALPEIKDTIAGDLGGASVAVEHSSSPPPGIGTAGGQPPTSSPRPDGTPPSAAEVGAAEGQRPSSSPPPGVGTAGGQPPASSPRPDGTPPSSAEVGAAGVQRPSSSPPPAGAPASSAGVGEADGPLLAGVRRLRVSAESALDVGAPGAVAVAGKWLWTLPLGEGDVWIGAGPDLIENRRLDLLDNAQLWANLGARRIAFDEFHHRAPVAPRWSANLWATLAQFILVALLFVAARAPRLGPPRPTATAAHRSSLEYVRSMGALLRRAGVEPELKLQLRDRLRRLMHERLGIPVALGADDASRALASHTGLPPDAWARLERALSSATSGFAIVSAEAARLEDAMVGRRPKAPARGAFPDRQT